MRATVIYESMYGNTRQIAQAIAEGLGDDANVDVRPVAEALVERPVAANLIVLGGPTHMFGMSGPGSRKMAVTAAGKPDSGLVMEPGSQGPGIREWLVNSVGQGRCAVAFDTRLHGGITGRASRPITKLLKRHGFVVLTEPQSFFVTKQNMLEDGEVERARDWGKELAARFDRQCGAEPLV